MKSDPSHVLHFQRIFSRIQLGGGRDVILNFVNGIIKNNNNYESHKRVNKFEISATRRISFNLIGIDRGLNHHKDLNYVQI